MIKPQTRNRRDQPRVPDTQMSHANPFDGRGRSVSVRRRNSLPLAGDRDQFRRRWSMLMIASFGSRECCAVHFAKTFQTACNWFDGTATPTGEVVHHALQTLPRYVEIMGDADCEN